MDSLAELMKKMAIDVGIPASWVHTRSSNEIPGYFRATKKWDLIVISEEGKLRESVDDRETGRRLLACVELKSQVGSFGNNVNNRAEEVLGVAVDVHKAFEYGVFGKQQPFWAGYLTVVEKTEETMTPVEVKEPYFPVLPEFRDATYMERWRLLCYRLMMERHYDSTCLIWASRTDGHITSGFPDVKLSFRQFATSFMHSLQAKLEAST